jgi:hypothetical protein
MERERTENRTIRNSRWKENGQRTERLGTADGKITDREQNDKEQPMERERTENKTIRNSQWKENGQRTER